MCENIIRSEIDSLIPSILERAQELNDLQACLPRTHFSKAISQCKSMYIMGYFYGSIMVAQACAEGLAKHIARKKILDEKYYIDLPGNRGGSWVKERINKLYEEDLISEIDKDSLTSIHDAYRNDLHHMNDGVPVSNEILKDHAFECVNNIYSISLIGMRIVEGGRISVNDPDLWESQNGMIEVYVDCIYL